MELQENKEYALYEAIADIALQVGERRFISNNSRLVIVYIIDWAKEFEEINKDVVWGITSEIEYIEAIDRFTDEKIKFAIDNELGYIDSY